MVIRGNISQKVCYFVFMNRNTLQDLKKRTWEKGGERLGPLVLPFSAAPNTTQINVSVLFTKDT